MFLQVLGPKASVYYGRFYMQACLLDFTILLYAFTMEFFLEFYSMFGVCLMVLWNGNFMLKTLGNPALDIP